MTIISRLFVVLLLCVWFQAGVAFDPSTQGITRVRHELTVRLSPAEHRLEGEDVISFTTTGSLPQGPLRFYLHAKLRVESADSDYIIERLSDRAPADTADEYGAAVPLQAYELRPAGKTWPRDPKPRLRFQGTIYHPLAAEQENYARSFSRSPGLIDKRGVLLSGSAFWTPWFGESLVSFSLTATVPADWDVVSQGERILHERQGDSRQVTWTSPEPTDSIYLIAGPFTKYSRTAGNITAYAFLRQPDPNLAAKYLEATAQYIEMYRQLIGPYPYQKFALVENFWETGYGMPSFTLLGPKVIRLPFILHSSYPHEILHNWWGNGVYVDYAKGNWAEGLTAYLADHLIKEQRAQGVDYRRNVLKKYRNHVNSATDFPLTAFRARHSSASEAVGYGKSLLLWHMLRRQLGDEKFTEGLQRFYRQYRFRKASYGDLKKVFSQVAGEDLTPFFTQWVERAGAPALSLDSEALDDRRIRVTVRQTQPGELFRLTVPLAVTMAGKSQAKIFPLTLQEQEATFELNLPAPVLRVDLDPYFDVFRRLDRQEIPPALSELFGAEPVTLVLPDKDEAITPAAWKNFAQSWSRGQAHQVVIVQEKALRELPRAGAVWILGKQNGWRDAVLAGMAHYDAGLQGGQIHLNGTRLPETDHSFVYAARHPDHPDLTLGWIGADQAAALPGLARKVPHYGRYSYLAFAGKEPANVAKGQWPTIGSPLSNVLARPNATEDRALVEMAKLPARQPLARLTPVFDPARLTAHVEFLASDKLEGRGIGTVGLRAAGDYIAEQFQQAGLQPGGDEGSYFQSWIESGGPDDQPVTLRNVIGVLPGTKDTWREQSVVIGAHYDHLGRGWPEVRTGQQGKIHNGADDNASGVAVLLELATLLGQHLKPQRTIVFVAFSGEEWGRRGSRHYIQAMEHWPAKAALAMINMDTVGRLEGKQLMMLGAGSASEWIHIVRGVGYTTGIEAKAILDDPGGSDQKSFHQVGVPAVQLFTGAHKDFHRPSDDVDKVDAEGLVKVAAFAREMAVYLSERDRPLTTKLTGAVARSETTSVGAKRRVTLGTVPDYAYTGAGVRTDSVIPDSPAAAAGLKDGDIVVAIDDKPITDLQILADILRKHNPGDVIRVQVRRGDQAMTLKLKLAAR